MAALALALAALATAAHAQLGDPGETTGVDTEATPVAKDPPEGMWKQVAGARYPATRVIRDSVTPYELDLYDVSLLNVEEGFAGGAECREPVPAAETESCERVPVIYRYTAPNGEADRWEEAYRGERPGFVAQIAWIGPGRALAVGGDGSYPRREPPAGEPDPAGGGRAWLYESGAWRELEQRPDGEPGDELPDAMRGLSALDCSPRKEELCIAGGLRQLWRWRDGAFDPEGVSDKSPESKLAGASLFRFRVRDVKFVPGTDTPPVQAVAVTSGCCAAEIGSAKDVPATLIYDGTKWYVRPQSEQTRTPVPVPDPSDPTVHTSRPDSYLSLVLDATRMSVVAAPGGPEPAAGSEPASRVTVAGPTPAPGEPGSGAPIRYYYRGDYYNEYEISGTGWRLPPDVTPASTLRLVSGDAVGGAQVEWAVGGLSSSGQGAAYTTTAGFGSSIWSFQNNRFLLFGLRPNARLLVPIPWRCTSPDPKCIRDDYSSDFAAPLYKLPSYGLNSLDFVGNSGSGFAVGDHGAILRVSGAGGLAEPGAPILGARKPAPLSSREPYDPFRPPTATGDVGAVPPLGAQPLERLGEPRFVPGGTSGLDRVDRIVMSADGREGWAFFTTNEGTRASHYNGSSWIPCDGSAADAACEGAPSAIAAARVPLERDVKPANDEQFEVVAISDERTHRYERGRWRVEEGGPLGGVGQPLWDVAFTAPDDGWVTGRGGIGTLNRRAAIYRFDDEKWIDCRAERQRCGDPGGRLPIDRNLEPPQTNPRGIRLTTAGERVYLYGTRVEQADQNVGNAQAPANNWPMIIYRDRGGTWKAEDGGYDPGGDSPPGAERGRVYSVSVAKRTDGGLEGWAVGEFGSAGVLRLEPGGRWERWAGEGPGDPGNPTRLLTVPREDGGVLSVFAGTQGDPFFNPPGPVLAFNGERRRWQQLPTPWLSGSSPERKQHGRGSVQALGADGQGGFWAAVQQRTGPEESGRVLFYHYTDRPRRPVFEDIAHPVRGRIALMAGGADGSLWVATDTGVLYRYDRLTGWEPGVRVPGWDPGRVVTAPSPVSAIALGPDGRGVAVGPRGRIAALGPEGVQLDPAAGSVCDLNAPVPPCGTGRDLRAAAVAPGGSALVGGEGPTLLWRPEGGQFRLIPRPPQVNPGAPIDAVTMPSPDRAWLAAEGKILAGRLSAEGRWEWTPENLGPDGEVAEGLGAGTVAVEASGRGYAFGPGGHLERTSEGEWRPSGIGGPGPLTLPPPGTRGGGALVAGGAYGAVHTLVGDRVEVAKPADAFDPLQGTSLQPGRVAAVALTPGLKPGQVEAWVALEGVGERKNAILHYASDPEEPLLKPDHRARPLPDAPLPREGEIGFAAFGKSDCRERQGDYCRPTNDSNLANEVIARQVREEIVARSRRAGGPTFALFTGDVSDAAGGGGGSLPVRVAGVASTTPSDPSPNHARWAELVADRFGNAGVPLFAAIGGQDLSPAQVCAVSPVRCRGTRQVNARQFGQFTSEVPIANNLAGANFAWRQAMASRPAPWGKGDAARPGSLSFRPVPDPLLSTPTPDADDPSGGQVPKALGGARTHYAVDVVDTGGTADPSDDGRLARLVFVDTSLQSLAAADPVQQPLEPGGGQLAWLERMLCRQGDASVAGRCTRKPWQRAIVVSNTPTYSYGPGAVTETQADATAFETVLTRHRAGVVVSGRLGWNGLYWATAPGVHCPKPGEAYQPQAPGDAASCGQTAPAASAPAVPAGAELSDALGSLGAPPPPQVDQVTGAGHDLGGILPFVVASSAGGRFGPDDGEERPASEGFWRGYTIVRLDRSGDPARTIVEQRPVLDWIGIQAKEHTLRPGQRLTLRGYGREPAGLDEGEDQRYIELDSPAVTHRYDLLEADPEQPWVPRRGADGQYVPLPADVATIDSQTGHIRAGRGNHPRMFAIGVLSVADHVATWPLVFEPRRSFRPKPAASLPALPLPKVAASAAAAIQSPQSPPPVNPPTPQVNLPAPPVIPSLPTPTANPPSPPAPPAPPPPPVSPQATPLDLVTSPLGLNIAPQATVIPPPAPPIQPAPPGGARREARQRQAATQKSGADSVGSELSEAGGDMVTSESDRGTLAATRWRPEHLSHLDARPAASQHQRWFATRVGAGSSLPASPRAAPSLLLERPGRTPSSIGTPRPAPSITTVHTPQPSAWPRNLAYAGTLTLASLLLATAFTLARPHPRRRRPTPVPSYLHRRR